MANITGTNGNDVLTGIAGKNIVNALGGNDRIIPLATSLAEIDGGAGYDTLDYSSLKGRTDLRYFATTSEDVSIDYSRSLIVDKFNVNNALDGVDVAKNIENIIGGTNKDNTITVFPSDGDRVDIDLSKNMLKYSSVPYGIKNLTIKNFNNIQGLVEGGSNPSVFSRFTGNDLDNSIIATNNSIIFGSKGNDTLVGRNIDYSNLGRAVKFVTEGSIGKNGGIYATRAFHSSKVDKNGFGVDAIGIDISMATEKPRQTIIGATNKANLLDASNVTSTDRIEVNLANNSFKAITVSDLNISAVSASQDYELVNFVDVIGSKYDDKIVGANKKGKLTGGAGNDSITGGSKNDIITGSDSTARGVGEIDTLTGGGGKDKFVLGDKNGAYYVGKGNNDYALITDFNVFEDSISIGSLKNYSFALKGKDTIDLYSGKDVKTRDLIAKIQIAGGISSVNNNAKSAMSPDASLNALVGKINIISG